MAVKSLQRVPTHIWIPPIYDALYKIEVVGDTTTDITDLILGGKLTDGVTETIGNFEFTIDNSAETYTDFWSNNDVSNVYINYAKTATTKRFRGRIEKVSYQNNTVRITGRSESSKLLGITVTKEYAATETSVILKALFDSYATDFTQTNINASTKSVTATWYQKPFWECVQELCHLSGFDCYIDADLDCHYYESGTVNNTTEAVVHDSNLFEVGDFAYDQSLLKNRIIVYGADVGELPLIKTAEDATSQAAYGVKELIINDSSITTETQAQERADYELDISKDPPLVGDVTCKMLAVIQPGENIRISAPYSNLNPAYYKIVTFSHDFDSLQTNLTIEKEPRKIHHLMRDRISNEQKLSETPNPNEMRYSWNFDYGTDTGTHSTTEITENVLKTDGSASGTWISAVKAESSNRTSCELRVVGETLVGTVYYVSVDDGNNWQGVSPNTSKTLSPPGKNLKIKVELNSADTQIKSLALLYK